MQYKNFYNAVKRAVIEFDSARPKRKRLDLTDDQVRAIHADVREYKIIAAEHGISRASVARIKAGEIFIEVTGGKRGAGGQREVVVSRDVARAIFVDPRPMKQIAAEHGLSFNAVWQIKNGLSHSGMTRDLKPVIRKVGRQAHD